LEGVVIASKTTATQLVEDLLATFCDPDACVAELLCDRHPADAVAFTIVERPRDGGSNARPNASRNGSSARQE
jgi:hypothetical protein